MNLNLIRKYLPEFNSYVKGQPLLIGFKRSTGVYKWKPLVWEDWGNGLIGDFIIINDEYCTYRKALAEGKQLQSRDRTSYLCSPTKYGEWSDTNHTSFCLPVDCYRIKPEEPEFKIGDWIIEIYGKQIGQVLELFDNQIRVKLFKSNSIITTDSSDFIKWQPQPCEVCIFWDDKRTYAKISKFSHMKHIIYFEDKEETYWDNCMPFTGILPPHMKENK